MKVRFLAPTRGTPWQQNLTSFLIDETVALNAGYIGFYGNPVEQAKVQHLFLSNNQIRNIASLPIFVENAYEPIPDCVTIHASRSVLDGLQQYVFNDRVWPDFIALSKPEAPFLRTVELGPDQTAAVESLKVTAVAVNHTVPSQAFLVENASSSVLFIPDTGPTQRVWQLANKTENLRAIFVHIPYPDEHRHEADAEHTMTPSSLREALQNLTGNPAVHAVVSSVFSEQVVNQLAGTGVFPVDSTRVYEF